MYSPGARLPRVNRNWWADMAGDESVSVPVAHDTIDGLLPPAANPVVIGHDETRHFLAHAWREGHLHHALLFEGPQGTGKGTLAFHLANHILTPTAGGVPADILPAPDTSHPVFRQIAGGMHPAVLHITRPKDPRSGQFRTAITVDEIRKVTHLLTRTSHDRSWRVVIIDPADDMNRSAANALLKTLEEPPARALFVLVSHSAGRLLPTIRSRCQAIRFQPLVDADLRSALTRLGVSSAGAPELDALVREAEGSVRKAALLVLYGGLDIARAVDAVLAAPTFDAAQAQKLAQALTGREAEIQYELFLDHLLQRVAKQAAEAALAGSAAAANSWSALWQTLRSEANNAGAFNLDRKQTVLILLDKARRGFAG